MSQSRMDCISTLLRPMYAPRHRTTLWKGSDARYAVRKSSSVMNTLSLASLLWRMSVRLTRSVPVWNSIMQDRLLRYAMRTLSFTGMDLHRYCMSSVSICGASVGRLSPHRNNRQRWTLLRCVAMVFSLRFVALRWSSHSSVWAIEKRVSGCLMTDGIWSRRWLLSLTSRGGPKRFREVRYPHIPSDTDKTSRLGRGRVGHPGSL